MNRKTLFAALACALLTFSMLGCGTSNHLQSIQITASLINGVVPTTQTGFYVLQGLGGTIQLQATGNYSSGQTKILNNVGVVYTMVVDPNADLDQFGNVLAAPPQTAEISANGLVTSTEPAACTYVNSDPNGTAPAWGFVGDYLVTVTYQGITSNPIYIPVASQTGIVSNSNPTGALRTQFLVSTFANLTFFREDGARLPSSPPFYWSPLSTNLPFQLPV